MLKLRSRPRLEVATLLLLLLFFAGAFALTYTFAVRAEIYPRIVSAIGMAVITAEIAVFIYQTYKHRHTAPTGRTELAATLQEMRAVLPYVLWLLFYYLMIWIIGLVIASGAFVFLFLLFIGRMKPWQALIGGLATAAAVFLIVDLLTLALPTALFDPFHEFRRVLRLPF